MWRCPNCGQTRFGDVPPDMCDFCNDFTTWALYPVNGHTEVYIYIQLPLPLKYYDDPPVPPTVKTSGGKRQDRGS